MNAILIPLRRLNDALHVCAVTLASAIVAVMVLALTASAAARYMSGTGYDWLIELPPALVPWLVFPLLGPLLRSGGHIRVDIAPALLPTRAWRILRFVNGSIAFGAAIVFLLAGREAVSLFIGLGQMMELEIDIPIWWMYLAFPVGLAMMAFFALEELLDAGRDLLRHPPEGTA